MGPLPREFAELNQSLKNTTRRLPRKQNADASNIEAAEAPSVAPKVSSDAPEKKHQQKAADDQKNNYRQKAQEP